MNNSKFAIDQTLTEVPVIDRSPALRERESVLVQIIEALKGVSNTDNWSSLKKHVFDGLTIRLERDLLIEAKKDSPDQSVLARLNGQLIWAKKYADLDKLADTFRLELKQIRLNLYGTSSKDSGTSE